MNNIIKRMAILCAVCMFQFTYAEECNVSSAGPADFDTDGNGVLDGFNAYANNGSITARIYDDAGNDVGDAGDYLLVYHEDELRGVGISDAVPAFLGNGYAIAIVLYSDTAAGETMSFKYYNAASGMVVDLNETEVGNMTSFWSKMSRDIRPNSIGNVGPRSGTCSESRAASPNSCIRLNDSVNWGS